VEKKYFTHNNKYEYQEYVKSCTNIKSKKIKKKIKEEKIKIIIINIS